MLRQVSTMPRTCGLANDFRAARGMTISPIALRTDPTAKTQQCDGIGCNNGKRRSVMEVQLMIASTIASWTELRPFFSNVRLIEVKA
jgi:hypothetical protein